MSSRPRSPLDAQFMVSASCPAPGIYAIENVTTGDWYIGSSVNMRKRWQLHYCMLRAGKHHSPKLQASWRKHGEEAFRFIPLQVIEDKAQRLAIEQHFLSSLHPTYNVSPNAVSCAGVKRSSETVAKLRPILLAPERVAKFIAYAKQPKSTEHRARIASAHMGTPPTEETRAKLREAHTRRGPVSEETRAKMRAAAARRLAR